MALPAAGEQITFGQVNVQLKRPETNGIELNDAQVRGLAQKTSGQIAMSDLSGKWAGTKVVVGNDAKGYGFKASPWGTYGSIDGGYSNQGMTSVAWADPFGEGNKYIWLCTAPGSAKPGSQTLRITDSNFNPIATYTLGAWADYGNGQWYSATQSPVASNPFGGAGGVRWFTW